VPCHRARTETPMICRHPSLAGRDDAHRHEVRGLGDAVLSGRASQPFMPFLAPQSYPQMVVRRERSTVNAHGLPWTKCLWKCCSVRRGEAALDVQGYLFGRHSLRQAYPYIQKAHLGG
jgi:hypothetical protein